jgi:hypothetical protein
VDYIGSLIRYKTARAWNSLASSTEICSVPACLVSFWCGAYTSLPLYLIEHESWSHSDYADQLTVILGDFGRSDVTLDQQKKGLNSYISCSVEHFEVTVAPMCGSSATQHIEVVLSRSRTHDIRTQSAVNDSFSCLETSVRRGKRVSAECVSSTWKRLYIWARCCKPVIVHLSVLLVFYLMWNSVCLGVFSGYLWLWSKLTTATSVHSSVKIPALKSSVNVIWSTFFLPDAWQQGRMTIRQWCDSMPSCCKKDLERCL